MVRLFSKFKKMVVWTLLHSILFLAIYINNYAWSSHLEEDISHPLSSSFTRSINSNYDQQKVKQTSPLLSLPDDTQSHIYSYLSYPDLVKISAVSRYIPVENNWKAFTTFIAQRRKDEEVDQSISLENNSDDFIRSHQALNSLFSQISDNQVNGFKNVVYSTPKYFRTKNIQVFEASEDTLNEFKTRIIKLTTKAFAPPYRDYILAKACEMWGDFQGAIEYYRQLYTQMGIFDDQTIERKLDEHKKMTQDKETKRNKIENLRYDILRISKMKLLSHEAEVEEFETGIVNAVKVMA